MSRPCSSIAGSTDCAHDQEPGCAVKAALRRRDARPGRWESYLKLERELHHLERRLDKRALSRRAQAMEDAHCRGAGGGACETEPPRLTIGWGRCTHRPQPATPAGSS